MSHTREWRRAKRSGGKETVEETPRKRACLDLCIFFISASPELSEISLVAKRERRENCQSIMFDEERLHSHGVGNLPRVPTIKKKRPHSDSEEELTACIADVLTKFQSISKVPVYLLQNFKLKRECRLCRQCTCRVADCI